MSAINVLIVDDSDTVREIIAKTLKAAGIDVANSYEAANGQVALDVLGREHVDLVFSDLNMPVLNGIEMIKQMKQNVAWKGIPVVIVTTDGSTKRIAELKEMGVVAYIRKPFKPEDIRNVVDEILGKHHES